MGLSLAGGGGGEAGNGDIAYHLPAPARLVSIQQGPVRHPNGLPSGSCAAEACGSEGGTQSHGFPGWGEVKPGG